MNKNLKERKLQIGTGSALTNPPGSEQPYPAVPVPFFSVEVFFGAASNAEVSVYAQIADSEHLADDVAIGGSVRGPISHFAHTLRASVALHDLGKGTTRLAEARVPDPCFWTPESPYVYEVTVVVQRGDEVLATEQRTLAIRRLGTSGRSLYLDAKRWVPRAATVDAESLPSFADCRAASLGLIVTDPSEDMCARATREGVLMVARVTQPADEVAGAVRVLARHGAVGLVIVDHPPADRDSLKQAARNVILCERRSDANETPSSAWADAIVYEIDDCRRAAEFAGQAKLPVIALRRAAEVVVPSDARAACDALQRDLAEHGDFAGYFV